MSLCKLNILLPSGSGMKKLWSHSSGELLTGLFLVALPYFSSLLKWKAGGSQVLLSPYLCSKQSASCVLYWITLNSVHYHHLLQEGSVIMALSSSLARHRCFLLLSELGGGSWPAQGRRKASFQSLHQVWAINFTFNISVTNFPRYHDPKVWNLLTSDQCPKRCCVTPACPDSMVCL